MGSFGGGVVSSRTWIESSWSVNHRLPSGPLAMWVGVVTVPVGSLNVVIDPSSGSIRPIPPLSTEKIVNHRLPSAPVVIPIGEMTASAGSV